ncbi:MAG: 3,4-dihydroxy-2-butanone-4-phosphate synthase [Oligoflexia bacterium]|nr:3,4-dihydroxy-2-butanone-4-phosphate synthase [Oligoflexia bacterium]
MDSPAQHFLNNFRLTRLGVLLDDSNPPGRAALCAPAQACAHDEMNRIINLSGGIVFVPLSPERAAAFTLAKMPRASLAGDGFHNSALNSSVSVEAREGVSTGISAADRARTVSILGEAQPVARKLVTPGHIFPIETRPGGVLVRNSLHEGALDVTTLAGFSDAAILVDLIGPSGEYLSAEAAALLAKREGLPVLSLSQLVRHRLQSERLVQRVAEARLPTRLAGELRSFVYRSHLFEGEHVALVKGNVETDEPILTRVQPEFTFGDVFGGNSPASRNTLLGAMKAIGDRGRGVLIYLRRTELGELRRQVATWKECVDAQSPSLMRQYGIGAQILRDLGVSRIELMTNSKRHLAGLQPFGLQITSQVPVPTISEPL